MINVMIYDLKTGSETGGGSRGRAIGITAAVAVVIVVGAIVVAGSGRAVGRHKFAIEGYKALADDLNKTVDAIRKTISSEPEFVDPVTPAGKEPMLTPDREMILRGVAWKKDRPLAFLNDKVVGLGDEIDGLVVVGIYEESVKLVNRGGEFVTVQLYEE